VSSRDVTLARHYQVIWLLVQGRSAAETAELTGGHHARLLIVAALPARTIAPIASIRCQMNNSTVAWAVIGQGRFVSKVIVIGLAIGETTTAKAKSSGPL